MGDQSDILAALRDSTKGRKVLPRDVIKDFNVLLNSRDHEVAKDISVVLENFNPTSPLEKLLRTKLVDRYKVSSEAWKFLMSNDSLYVNQALKFNWFFSNNEDPAHFLQNIIPKLSYSTRLKILNRYALRLRNTAVGEAIYLGVKSRYGISTAALILPACSEPFIDDELCLFTTTALPRHVVMALLDKYPKLSTKYLEKLVDEKASRKHKNIDHFACAFIKLSNNDFSLFVALLDKHGKCFPDLKLGKRQLKKLLKNHFDVIPGNNKKFINSFSEKQFFRSLSLDQFKKVYAESILPSKLLDFFELPHWEIGYRCLGYLKPSISPDVLTSAFQVKYKRDCTSEDLLLKFPSQWLQHLPVEARVKWVDTKIEKMDSIEEQAECIAYLPLEVSVPRIKNLMTSQSSPKVRENIARYLIRTVKLNACPSALKDVVAYLVKRVRNETSQFQENVLYELVEHDEMFLKLDLDDWAPIQQLINIANLSECGWLTWKTKTIFCQLIHTCFSKNIDADPYLQMYVDRFCNRGDLDSFAVDIGNYKPFQKICLEWFVDKIPNIKFESNYNKIDVDLHLLENICLYNRMHKQSKMEIPDWLKERLEKVASNPDLDHHVMERIVKALKTNKSEQLCDHLLGMCFPKYAPCSVLCTVLQKNPHMIVNNVDILVEHMVKQKSFQEYSYFYRKCRLYDLYDIPSEIIKSYLLIVEQKVSEEMDVLECRNQQIRKSHAVQALAFLQDPSTYLDFCTKHTPSQKKIEDYSKEIQMEYAIQLAVCKSLTHLSTPAETLLLLPNFTKGDYLKIVCGSLIGICVKIPENNILPIFEQWIDCPVSLRKHILRLMYNIAPIEYSIAAFKKLFEAEKNTSLRLVLFLRVRDRFIAEPTDDSYGTFVSIVQQLKDDDKEILDKLLDIDDIHDAYISQYIELVWQLIDSKWSNVLPRGKSTMINAIDKNSFTLIDKSVCDVLLKHELTSKLPSTTLSRFVSYYLLYCPSDETEQHSLDTVMATLELSVKTHWNEPDLSGNGYFYPIRHVISDIIESLCHESVDSEKHARASAVLSEVKKALLSFIPQQDFLKESVQLDVYSLYLSLKGSGYESMFASALANLYDNYIQQYESQFGYSLVHHLTRNIPMVSVTELAYELLTKHKHPTCHILASEIASSMLSEEKEMPLYETIIDTLLSSKIPAVQATAAYYFRTLEASIAMKSCDPTNH